MTTWQPSWAKASRWRAAVAALVASLLLAACGSSGGVPTPGGSAPAASAAVATSAASTSPVAAPSAAATSGPATPNPTAAATPNATVPATPAPTPVSPTAVTTPAPTAAPSATAPPAPTFSGDLASLIPAMIGGNTMIIEAGRPEDFLGLWNNKQRAQALLASLGKSVSDVSIVNSYGKEATSPQGIFVYAYRVAGADGEALLQGMTKEYLRLLPGGSRRQSPWAARPPSFSQRPMPRPRRGSTSTGSMTS